VMPIIAHCRLLGRERWTLWVAVCGDDQSTGCQVLDAKSSESASHAPCVSRVRRNDEREAEQRRVQVERALEQVGPPFVTYTKAATTQQPGERALHHPAMAAEPLRRVDPTSGNPWGDAPSAQGTAEVRGVVGLVGVQLDPGACGDVRAVRADRRSGADMPAVSTTLVTPGDEAMRR
jgi:hypothetical protein